MKEKGHRTLLRWYNDLELAEIVYERDNNNCIIHKRPLNTYSCLFCCTELQSRYTIFLTCMSSYCKVCNNACTSLAAVKCGPRLLQRKVITTRCIQTTCRHKRDGRKSQRTLGFNHSSYCLLHLVSATTFLKVNISTYLKYGYTK